MALGVLQGGDLMQDLIGIAAGHTYIYIKTVLPTSHGYRVLEKLHPRAEKLIKFIDYYWNYFFPQNRAPGSNAWGQGGRVDTSSTNNEPRDNGARFRAFTGTGVRIGGN
jgi:hypothetical protein